MDFWNPFVEVVDIFMFSKLSRNTKSKQDNLNGSNPARKPYETSSDEEYLEESSTKDATTTTDREKFCQTEFSGKQKNWRYSTDINGNFEKS